jgi:hypothetical protein
MNALAIRPFNPALAVKQSIAAVLIAAVLMTSSCSLYQGIFGKGLPSTTQVTTDTALVVTSTREVVLLLGPASEATLNAYILVAHNFLATLAAGIQAGTSVLPTPDTIQADLVKLAASFGNPYWAVNMAGNLATEYGKFYAAVGTSSVVIYNYLEAFAIGTV